MNYRLMIQYEGTRYRGWQSQITTDATIQGKLSGVLSRMAGQEIEVQGSGRTDAGVHARAQVASVQLPGDFTPEEIRSYCNKYLPEDIVVTSVEQAGFRFHARLNALRKTYVYRIWNSEISDVFQRRWVYQLADSLNVQAMEEAAGLLLGTHDFAAFTTTRSKKKSTVRTIYQLKVERVEEEVRLTVTGNGFLHHMVRILAGTLVEVGLGERSPQEMPEILKKRERQLAGEMLPASGLTLWQVDYD